MSSQAAAERVLEGMTRWISEIAFASGFNNLASFNRLFCAQYGKSPRDFRKQMRARAGMCPPPPPPPRNQSIRWVLM
ncbi:MAG: helix-turn-helix domain-containing protein [Opitutaceae bacterium]|nr:helix-turn-helix domain-containing protein [Opitutaceae bacterium]